MGLSRPCNCFAKVFWSLAACTGLLAAAVASPSLAADLPQATGGVGAAICAATPCGSALDVKFKTNLGRIALNYCF